MAENNVKVLNGVEIYLDTRTTAQWGEVTKNIPKGFVCVELMTDEKCRLKVGDGTKTFAQLPYAGGDIDAEQVENLVTEKIAGLGSLFTFKGRVDNVELLPTEDNNKGDVWLVGAEGADAFSEYYWTGTFFDYMGMTTTVDLSDYYKKSDIDSKLSGKTDVSVSNELASRITTIENDYLKSSDTLTITCKIS